ncbi:unnamed protein product [Prunus armeniaca]
MRQLYATKYHLWSGFRDCSEQQVKLGPYPETQVLIVQLHEARCSHEGEPPLAYHLEPQHRFIGKWDSTSSRIDSQPISTLTLFFSFSISANHGRKALETFIEQHSCWPRGADVVLCIEKALAQSGVSREYVRYINTHATSTPAGGPETSKSIMLLFIVLAKILRVNSTKSIIARLLGAAGTVEAVAPLQIHPPNFIFWSMVQPTYDDKDSINEDVGEAFAGDNDGGMDYGIKQSLEEQHFDFAEVGYALNKMSITLKDSLHSRFGSAINQRMRMPSRMRASTSPESYKLKV